MEKDSNAEAVCLDNISHTSDRQFDRENVTPTHHGAFC